MGGKKLLTGFLTGILLLGSAPVAIFGDELSDVAKKEQEVQATNNALSKEIQQALAQIDEKTVEISDLNEEISNTQQDIAKKEEAIQVSKETIEKRRAAAAERLKAMQVQSATSNLQMLLEAKNFSDFISRAIVLGKLQAADNEKVASLVSEKEKITGLMEDLKAAQKTLEEKKSELTSTKESLDSQLNQLQTTYASNATVLKELSQKKEEIKAQKAKEEAEAKAKAEAQAKAEAKAKAEAEAKAKALAAEKQAEAEKEKTVSKSQVTTNTSNSNNSTSVTTPSKPEVDEEKPSQPVKPSQPTESTGNNNNTNSNSGFISLDDFLFQGVVYANGYKFTYYSQSVLPGGGLSIPGRHVNANGYVCDGDGYIVAAGSLAMGSVVPTPFGASAKIYDRGTTGNHIDIYIR